MSDRKEKTSGQGSLSRGDLISMAVGQVIGVGIMAMTGTGIAMTGRSVNIAFIIGGILTIFSAIPQIFIGGTARFYGGQYSQIAVLKGKRLAGIYTYINLATAFAVSMYVLSFTEYFLAIVPGAPAKLIAVIVLTMLFGLHLVGVKQAARLQNIMCVVLALAMAAYVVCGITKIQPGYFEQPEFMTKGISGFLLASVFLSFASGGATYVVNYSSEAKNPTKDIPFVIVVSTLGIVVLYAVMATIAAGVLPVAEVAGKPLSVSAAAFMSPAVYTFFVVGGAMFSLLTTLNFVIGMMVYPALQASKDGWLPKVISTRNKKFGTPHWILLAFYLVGVLPVVLGIDLSTIANSTVILTTTIRGLIAFSAMSLPEQMPRLWEKSKFYLSRGKLRTICIATMIVAAISVCILIMSSSKTQIIGNIAILVVSILLSCICNKHVHLEPGYEEK